MKRLLACIVSAVLLVGMVTGCSADQGGGEEAGGKPLQLQFPTATTSGAIYPIGAAIAELWNQNIDGLEVSAEASNGGVQNLGLMSTGEAQVSVAVTNIITEQKEGRGKFEGRAYDGVRILSALYSNYNQVVVTKDSGINTMTDLKGKRFAPGASGSTPEVETGIYFQAAGMNYPDDIQAQFVGFTEAVDLMRNKQLDGAWIQAGLPTAAVSEMCATANGKLVSFDEDVIAELTAEYPWYNRALIPAGTYDGQEEDVVTTSIVITLMVDESVPEDVVYEMAKVLWENVEGLKGTHNALKAMAVENAVQDLAGLPLHDGAARYYREVGVL
ncbi:MAG TPA: TAXI family TRAP transporter solute-binding subunit [bacterium]|nr:TAXI family TRAP transporter solute-binding subunit [bacterium]